ncbi:hypothetical protein GF318_05925 [Candidatus Micrarchaeota archaeon]|nr:hypothetical protein [Candidatus Micrarchaeota archaeon]
MGLRVISLRHNDICQFKNISPQLTRKSLERFKRLTENGCVPLHLHTEKGARSSRSVYVIPAYGRLSDLRLPDSIREKASAIRSRENAKAGGRWVDSDKLAVDSLGILPGTISALVTKMKLSETLAMKHFGIEDICRLKAFRLNTNAHVTARDNGREVLLVAQKETTPSGKRMGDNALLSEKTRGGLASNGMFDADVISSEKRAGDAWESCCRKEFEEETGISLETTNPDYLGLVMDTVQPVGAIGILGILRAELETKQIDEARKKANGSAGIAALDTIPMEGSAMARYLRENRDSMVPQLITGLVILGYENWGAEFLRQADK